MSWMKRPPSGTASAAPGAAGHVATQPYGNEQNMYPNYQQPNAGHPQQAAQQQYWGTQPQQPMQYNQQYNQVYQQDYAPNNANQVYQHQQYNQNYSNQTYNATQPGYQQNYYPNPPVQQNYSQAPLANAKQDGWEDNWDWGWEDSAKQAQRVAQEQLTTPAAPLPHPSLQQQQLHHPSSFNNANIIEESFTSTDTWNWASEDKNKQHNKEVQQPPVSVNPMTTSEPALSSDKVSSPAPSQHSVSCSSEPQTQRSASNLSSHNATEEVRTLNDKDVVKERLPNLALGKRFHLENLTPQWSTESQMSQESSDGVQTHSESTYMSESQSRNSNASPVNVDQYSQSALEGSPPNTEWSRNSMDEPTLLENTPRNFQPEDEEVVTNSLKEMNINSSENLSVNSVYSNQGENFVAPEMLLPPVVSQPPLIPPHPSSSSLPPTTIVSTGVPPLQAHSSSNVPPNFIASTNPFKNAGGFSHKSTSKVVSNVPSTNQFPPMSKEVPSPSNSNLTSPSAVNKIQHARTPAGFSANLETTPDNSERPDQPQMSPFRPMQVPPQMPDNLEVAPQNDRNEYLQTAHLSSGDYGVNTDFSRSIPPPGLRRMVVGQQEPEYGAGSVSMPGEGPPPGLARMVPGQQTDQGGDAYMERHIDGQPTDAPARPYRQAEGQQTADYTQQGRGSRPSLSVGLDRMVPGEPSNEEYSQYQSGGFSSNEQRVVTGVDHEYSAGPSDIREQNVDGSDYTDHTPRSIPRNVLSSRETGEAPLDFGSVEDQREVTMEGENLQDLSIISSNEMAYSREQTLDGADVNVSETTDRKTDASDSVEVPASGSRRQSLNRTSGEDSERDRAPRRDRDKHKSTRDRDRDRDGRYSRDDKKKDRESDRRRSEKDRDRGRERREREESPTDRRHRRSTRSHRYETEDTDYYSDRERERRRHREGSYASKPPRPDDKDRRYRDERDRTRRYNTIERDRRYEDERDGATRSRRSDRERDRYSRQYRDIDPSRKHGNLRREEEERRRGELPGASPLAGGPREAGGTDEDEGGEDTRRRDRHRRSRHRHDPHYDQYAAEYSDPYLAQRRQYQYYEHLRLTDPAAYMQLYKKIMAEQAYAQPNAIYPDGYGPLSYEGRPEDSRGSVHSGRSSANGLHGTHTARCAGGEGGGGYYARSGERGGRTLDLDERSLRTDLSDRDMTTDASLNLHLEESTARSERMTPFKYSTAHVKGNMGCACVVVVRGSYPVDGAPAGVALVSLRGALGGQRGGQQLQQYPGPLLKGVTHKKSVIEYCQSRVRQVSSTSEVSQSEVSRDSVGYVLVWELLALMLTQNGVVVGADIAELLMRNTREHPHSDTQPAVVTRHAHSDSRRSSAEQGEGEGELTPAAAGDYSGDRPLSSPGGGVGVTSSVSSHTLQRGADEAEAEALDKLRDLLIVGDRHQALEWAMSSNQWSHALHLALFVSRRSRAAVLQRFLHQLTPADPLHTLYTALHHTAGSCSSVVSDWRAHAAILLSNSDLNPDHHQRTIIQLGDSLASRGLLYSAQFCYLSCGVPFTRHPLAPLSPPACPPGPGADPPRLTLLLADPRAPSLNSFASNEAIFATEIYEYAMSLSQDFVLGELPVYKLVLATRLLDCGEAARAHSYVERVSRVAASDVTRYCTLLPTLSELADRLRYHEPLLETEAAPDERDDSVETSPRHLTSPPLGPSPPPPWQQQLRDAVATVAAARTQSQSASWSAHSTPAHAQYGVCVPAPDPAPGPAPTPLHQWGEQQQQQQPPPYQAETGDLEYQQYQQQQYQHQQQQQQELEQQSYTYKEEWYQHDGAEPTPAQDTPYWQPDSAYHYSHQRDGAPEDAAPPHVAPLPAITMPGAAAAAKPLLYTDYDDDPQNNEQADVNGAESKSAKKEDSKSKEDPKGGGGGKGGWLGGILTKLSLRPPNQMILPDDKNPSIVWDEEHKRWRNVGGGDEDEFRAPPPPPPSCITPGAVPAGAGLAPGAPPPPVSNIFKMQKGRHIKKSYVDVFNPSGAASKPPPPAAELLPPSPAALPLTYFTPPARAPAGGHQNEQIIEMSEPSFAGDNSTVISKHPLFMPCAKPEEVTEEMMKPPSTDEAYWHQ